MDKIRVGFVGVGQMGQCAHLRNYVNQLDCEVVAIAELRPKLAKTVAMRYGIPNVYRNHREMIGAETLDGIVAVQPFTRHGQIVPELLKARVPIFIEKPLASSVETGERIVRAVEKSGTWVMVGYHKRSDPATIYAKGEIERLKQTGDLGEMRYVRITMPPGDWIEEGFIGQVITDDPVPKLEEDPPDPEIDEATYKEYVSFVNYYIHQVNLLGHLLGELYSIKYADVSERLLVGESTSGIPVVLEMAPYFTTLDWQESALVCFRNGWIMLELPAPLASNRPGVVKIFRDPAKGVVPQTVIPQLPWIGAMRQQAINFVKAVKGEIKPPCEAREAIDDLRIARDYIKYIKSSKSNP